MDSLFGGGWPLQWASPEAPEFHDLMAHMHDAGFKVLAANPSSDAAGNDPMRALEFYLKKINEHPERYKIVRTTRDIEDLARYSLIFWYADSLPERRMRSSMELHRFLQP